MAVDGRHQAGSIFGHGTGPSLDPPAKDSLFGPGGLDQRAAAVANGATAALPRDLRQQAGSLNRFGAADRLGALLTRWSGAARLGEERFAALFFDRDGRDPAVRALRMAASRVADAQDHAALRTASEQVAVAMKAIGLGNWQRFLSAAQVRAEEPATLAAVAAALPRAMPPSMVMKVADPPPVAAAPAEAPEPPMTQSGTGSTGSVWRKRGMSRQRACAG